MSAGGRRAARLGIGPLMRGVAAAALGMSAARTALASLGASGRPEATAQVVEMVLSAAGVCLVAGLMVAALRGAAWAARRVAVKRRIAVKR